MSFHREYDVDSSAGPRKRPSPTLTSVRLRQLAEDYVGRFGGPSSNLRRVLLRHVDKAQRAEQFGAEDVPGWLGQIQGIIDEFVQAGALDDGRYAQHAARIWTDRGLAPRATAFRLMQKGITSEDIRGAIAELGDAREVEWQAALQLAKRRRLGPFRSPEQRLERRQKDAAALARAGFSGAVVWKLVGLDPDQLDEL